MSGHSISFLVPYSDQTQSKVAIRFEYCPAHGASTRNYGMSTFRDEPARFLNDHGQEHKRIELTDSIHIEARSLHNIH